MKKIIKSIGIGVLASILGATLVLANVNYPLESQQTVVKIYDRRGNWVADGFLSISNPGNGKIGIYMSTLCHVPVDEIEMTIAIDQYKGSWTQVDYLTYNFFPENGKDGIEEASVDIELPGHEANQLYKLRGTHFVYLNGSSESLDSETGSMLITDH